MYGPFLEVKRGLCTSLSLKAAALRIPIACGGCPTTSLDISLTTGALVSWKLASSEKCIAVVAVNPRTKSISLGGSDDIDILISL